MDQARGVIRCPFGVASRIAAVACGLWAYKEIDIVWSVNEHCPVDHDVVFPDGVPGVRFVPRGDHPVEHCSVIEGRNAFEYNGNADYIGVLDRAAGVYRDAPPVAVHARYFRGPSTPSPELPPKDTPIFLFADSRRDLLTKRHGGPCTVARSPEMRHDKDRRPGDVVGFLSDLKTLSRCTTIYTNAKRSAMLHAARQAGARLVYPR